jgi:hypothetical protein
VELLYPGITSGALLSLPLFPIAYVYAVHRHRLGSLELRVNHLVSSFLFLTLIGTLSIPLIILIKASWSKNILSLPPNSFLNTRAIIPQAHYVLRTSSRSH